jgi:sugar lactone lactonase YvrE
MKETMSKRRLMWVAAAAFLLAANLASAQAPFESKRLTLTGCDFPKGIEGPGVDATGALFVVNFQKQGTIGKLPAGATQCELFVTLPTGSIGNGIRFDRDGRMYVADYKGHNIFVFEPGQNTPQVYFHDNNFHQPNDLAISTDGTLYASDPGKTDIGRIWRITRGSDGKARGEIMTSPRTMGKTNGIDLSPDGATLYVSESVKREVWAYRIDGANLRSASTTPLIRFENKPTNAELDGLRTDVDGNIFVTRPLTGTVAMVTPDGTVVRKIPLQGKNPTNLTFGGPDGKTVFVTTGEKTGGFIESFRVERPGREPCLQFAGAFC